MKDLKGKVAFVTGGASGVGLGMTNAFLARGMKVAIADVQKKRLAKAEAELDHGESVITVELDVCDLSAVERAADQMHGGRVAEDVGAVAHAGNHQTPRRAQFHAQSGTETPPQTTHGSCGVERARLLESKVILIQG